MENTNEIKKESKVKAWFLEHKEIIFTAGAFLLGCVVKGIYDRKRIEFFETQAMDYYNESLKAYDRGKKDAAYDIYKECIEHANSVLIPDINKRYEGISFVEDEEAHKQYYDDFDRAFNHTFETIVCKYAGVPANPNVDIIDLDTGEITSTTL